MSTRIIGAADIARMLEIVGRHEFMDLMIDALRGRFENFDAGEVQARARDGFRYDKPDLGLLEWMPTHEVSGPVVIKMVGYHPTNPVQRRLPSVIATSAMWDTTSGHLIALGDATLLTSVRTGAASAVATDLLSRPGAATLGVVGLGAQAVTQVHAISRVRPLERVIALDTDDEVAASFPDRIGFLDLDVEIVPTSRAATIVSDVDVLCTCTSVDIGAGPVIGEAEPRPWLHTNAVGADFPGKLELPRSLLDAALVVPDIRAQCVVEGECQQIPESQVGPELWELLQHPTGRADAGRPTVFDSTGWAVEDDAALRLAHRLSVEHDLGTDIVLESISSDPYDPYSPALGTPDPTETTTPST
ncbi:MAG: ornithine cyclodeaminase family protein [Acidimicrobiia bacterium]|nr:ornithine cyclodeaminase family protein [Acidimicrobiia bacterium]